MFYSKSANLIGCAIVFYSPIDNARVRVDIFRIQQLASVLIYVGKIHKYNFCAKEQVKLLLKQLDYSP